MSDSEPHDRTHASQESPDSSLASEPQATADGSLEVPGKYHIRLAPRLSYRRSIRRSRSESPDDQAVQHDSE